MIEKKFIYITREINADGSIQSFDGMAMFGIGQTNSIERRFGEHSHRGSKSSVGVDMIDYFDVKSTYNDTDVHGTINRFGIYKIKKKKRQR